MKALVTGGTGLVGSHLCFHLLQKGYGVKALFRKQERKALTKKVFSYYDTTNSLFSKIEWVKGDLLYIQDIEEVVRGVDVVFHTAAMVSFDPEDAEKIIRYNEDITNNLVAVLKEKHAQVPIIHCSSIAAIGKPTNFTALINEDIQWTDSPNNSPYAISKFLSELVVWRAAEEGLKVSIVNPGIILGPGFWNEGSGKLFTTYLKGFPFYTEGVNGFVDVNDVAKAMILLTENKLYSERFILVENNYSYREIFNMICDALGKKRPHIKIGKLASEIFWRLEFLRSKITGAKPLITKETAKSAVNRTMYDGTKILKKTHFQYTPLAQSIPIYAELLKKEMS
ncbi:NAD-dependent epimerase [Thermaurantimonas aggregans]|uniref:NAD-dependent epimerase n=1 Tax=Thermaurantimonas aggregans TaxID=2173829 RepID=A0A401XKW3_9FLAO|nr:NAD-dependent epimerase/dehydratase family protein [Thermaurantimonas aggregans]MCX8148241.1 NAD-dependent epimerase/dehydratase family protein [Thermaurantimonas aggregans]GCD77667.1 NAD-dependent epimerase [Thermaurantimonas aggregans]